MKYRDILPQAETLSKLRTGKVVRNDKMKSRYISGQARVLSSKHVNEGLKRLREAEEERIKRQRNAEQRKRMADERKEAKSTLETQWKVDIQHHSKVLIPAWQAACAEINKAWLKETGGSSGYGKKPPNLPRPKRPIKPKMTARDLSTVIEDAKVTVDQEEVEDEEELTNSLRGFEISHFRQVSMKEGM